MILDAGPLRDVFSNGWGPIVQALLLAVIGWVVLRLSLNWSVRAMRRGRIDTGTQILVKRALAVAIVILIVLMILGSLGINPAALVAVAGAVGLAFSLAIQDILKNFFNGVYILLERPFRVGDTIRVKEQQGVVENIGVRTTVLRTPNDVQVLVPNAVVFSEVVTNHTNAKPVQNLSQLGPEDGAPPDAVATGSTSPAPQHP